MDLAKGKKVEQPRSQGPDIISVEQGWKDYAGSLNMVNGKVEQKKTTPKPQSSRDNYWTDVGSPYGKDDGRAKIGDVGAGKPNSAKDVVSLKAAEKKQCLCN